MRNLWLTLILATPLFAQVPGDTRIHRGDDLRWADPAFDDSAWETVAAKGLPTWEDFAVNRIWSRMRVEIPSGEPVALVVRYCMCEFYLNGVRVGSTGDLNAARPSPGRAIQVFWLPPSIRAGSAMLAVREYIPPGYESVHGIWRSHFIRIVRGEQILPILERAQQVSFSTEIAIFQFVLLITVLVVLAGQKLDLLALLISAYLLAGGINTYLYGGAPTTDFYLNYFVAFIFTTSLPPLAVLAIGLLAGVPLRAWWAVPYLVIHFGLRGLWGLDYLRAEPAPWTPLFIVLYPGTLFLSVLIATALLIAGWRRPGASRLLAAAGLTTLLLSVLGRFGSGFGVVPSGIPLLGTILIWDRISNLSFGLLTAIYLIRRSRVRRAEELRLKSELKAAQGVQSLLLGQSLPSGVEAVYLPASEVGGDFYHAFATEGGTLAVVGDVSGKDLQAAMTVSTVVGALRNRHSDAPAEVLGELNRVLSGNAGFTTCCCVLIEGGEVRIANAGHPAPYLDGVEAAIEAGLPLGVVAETEYSESRFPQPRLLTLVSDGVVEAANAAGELFGFDRTRDHSTQSAQQIAEAAKAWGQNDDITVVTVRRDA